MKTTLKGTKCRFFHVLLALLIGGIGINTFTSCSSDSSGDGGGGVPFTENSQLYICYGEDSCNEKYTGNGSITNFIDSYSGGKFGDIDAGTVTNGIVNLNLPTVSGEFLDDFLEYWKMDEVSVTSEDVKILFAYLYFEGVRMKISSEFQKIGNATKGEEITYMYFSKPAKITGKAKITNKYGEIQDECGEYGETTFDIDAKSGWNMIYRSFEKTEVSCKVERNTYIMSTNNILTKEVKWVALAYDY